MRTVFVLIAVFIPGLLHGAAHVGSTHTQIDMTGVFGESDVLDPVEFKISAKIRDQDQPYPENELNLEKIEVTVGGVELDFSSVPYKKLNRVMLSKIDIAYIQTFKDTSWIKVTIPFGEYKFCENHDSPTKYSSTQRMVFNFNILGVFLKSKLLKACESAH